MKRILSFVLILVFALIGCTTKTTNSVSSIQIIPGNNLLSLNTSRGFTAVALDANGNALNVKNFTWTSSDPSVASVTDGQVTANKLGSSQITASANSVTSGPVNITVLEAVGTLSSGNASDLMPVLLLGRRLIAAIGLNPSKFAFPKPPLASDLEIAPYGSSVTVSGDNADSDGDGLPNDATSSFAGKYIHGTQAALNYSGTVRTQDTSSNNTDVTAEFNNLKLDGTINAQDYSYMLKGRQSLKNNGTRNDSMTLTSNATLELTGFGRNSTLEFVSSAQFVPDDAANPLAGGTLDWQDTIKTKLAGGTKILLERGEGVHLGTCGLYDSGRIVILDASTSLNVLEFGPGCGEVQFSRDGNSLVPTLGGTVTISPNAAALKYGQTQQFTALAMSISGEAISLPTGSATWNSSLPSFAAIDTNGLAKAQSITGITYITAKAFGVTSNTAVVSVTAPNVASITITPISASIPVGSTQAFTATAFDAGGTAIPGVAFAWTSSLPTVASIGSTTGVATGVAIGTTSITASSGGKSSSPAALTVTDFTLTTSPIALTIVRPVTISENFTATITLINGFAGAVAYSLEGAPAGVTVTTVIATNPSMLNLTVPASVLSSIVPYPFKLVATSGTTIRKADMTLTVTGP
jgi:trimeric autotransporter adhesin